MRVLLCLLLLSSPALAEDIEPGVPVASNAGASDLIRERVERELPKLHDCYDKQRLAGIVVGMATVKFTIEPTGKVSQSTAGAVGSAALGKVARCLADVIKTISFDLGAKTTVTYPFSFKSEDGAAPTGGSDADRMMVLRVIRRERSKLVACHEQVIQKEPGVVTAKFTVGRDGKVVKASATGMDAGMSSCVATALKLVTFDKPSKQIDVSYPFAFHSPVTIGASTSGSDDDKMMVRRFIKRNIARIQGCYEKGLEKQPALAGTVRVAFEVEATGRVSKSSAFGVDPEVAKCVAAVIQRIVFDTPSKAPLSINYPFNFRPASP